MAEKTTALTPAEWRGLCMLNVAQMHAWLESSAPNLDAAALPGMEAHLDRIRSFLRAWSVSQPPKPVETVEAKANGAAPVKKGGWPLGRPRKRQNPAVQQ